MVTITFTLYVYYLVTGYSIIVIVLNELLLLFTGYGLKLWRGLNCNSHLDILEVRM